MPSSSLPRSDIASALGDMLDLVLDDRRQATIALGRGDAVAAASARAAGLLAVYLPGPARPGALPDAVARWLAGTRAARLVPPEPLVVEGPDGALCVRLLTRAEPGGHDVLLLEERRRAGGRAALTALGLSARQAEVLELATRGRTNAEIAERMGISPRTVQKHLEHVFDRLGVRTRAGAAARAVAAMTAGG
jgi:DNA-binding CsgD family transcriptional regulator